MNYIQNIRSIYRLSTQAEWDAGYRWYIEANNLALEVANRTGCTVAQAAYAISAISPRTHWTENVRVIRLIADHMAAGHTDLSTFTEVVRVTKVNLAKAWTILTTGNLEAIGNGPKTRAFADNILHPYESKLVTIDSWAYRVAAGLIGITDEFKVALKGKVYDMIADAYLEAAEIELLRPNHLQAVTWVTAHRLEGKI